VAGGVVCATTAAATAIIARGIVGTARLAGSTGNVVCTTRLADVASGIVGTTALTDMANGIISTAARKGRARAYSNSGDGREDQRFLKGITHSLVPSPPSEQVGQQDNVSAPDLFPICTEILFFRPTGISRATNRCLNVPCKRAGFSFIAPDRGGHFNQERP
jgi:hypothetical protein